MTVYVYVLKCWKDPEEVNTYEFYTGFTSDLDRRLKQHYKGGYTKRFKKMVYAYFETAPSEPKAREREKFVKRQSRAWKENLIAKRREAQRP